MSGVEIRQRATLKGQEGQQERERGWPAPLYRVSRSTALEAFSKVLLMNTHNKVFNCPPVKRRAKVGLKILKKIGQK